MEVSGRLYVPAALPPGKEPLVSIGRRLDGMVRRKIPISYRDSNPRSSSPYH
jgi:hypothetical protein